MTVAWDAHAQGMLSRAVGDEQQAFGSFFLSRLLGMDVSYVEDSCVVTFEAAPTLFNPQGSLHGGVLATALDISMGHLLHHTQGAGVTLEMKTQYFAAVRHGHVKCRATFLKMGRRLFFLQSLAKDDRGEDIAFATSTWKLL